jgi:hypothetical protein
MRTITTLSLTLIVMAAFSGCGQAKPDAQPTESSVTPPAPQPELAPEVKEQFSENGDQTQLAPIAMDPFTVDALHIGEVAKGHFNLYVKGGEPAIVRAWIGDEAATDVFIARAEFEVDHHCAHIEVPDPIPADAKLWVEIETEDGTSLKGSTEIQ